MDTKFVRVGDADITGEDHSAWDGEFFTALCVLLGAGFEKDLLPWLAIFQLGKGKDGWVAIDKKGTIVGQRLWAPLSEYIERISRQAQSLMKNYNWAGPLLQLHLNAANYYEKYDASKVVNFGGFALIQALRGTGVAAELMSRSIDTIRKLGTYTHITVQCTSVRSRKWMEKFGFRVEHEWSYPTEYQDLEKLKQLGFDKVQYFTLMVLEL